MTNALDRALVLRAFSMMAEHLSRRRVRGELVIAGGAVMALQYDVDRVTRDVDGLITENHGAVSQVAQQVAGELGLPRGWLNGGISVYLSTEADPERATVFDHPNLGVFAASPRLMVALKARAGRAQDVDDLRVLISALNLKTSDEVVATVTEFFPDDPLSERSLSVLQDLFHQEPS